MSPDVVYEIPQSRERIRGRAAYREFNADLPRRLAPRAQGGDRGRRARGGVVRLAGRRRRGATPRSSSTSAPTGSSPRSRHSGRRALRPARASRRTCWSVGDRGPRRDRAGPGRDRDAAPRLATRPRTSARITTPSARASGVVRARARPAGVLAGAGRRTSRSPCSTCWSSPGCPRRGRPGHSADPVGLPGQLLRAARAPRPWLGGRMLDACAAYADEHGFARIVRSPSERSSPLYARQGFEPAISLMRASRAAAPDWCTAPAGPRRTPAGRRTQPTANSGTVSAVSSTAARSSRRWRRRAPRPRTDRARPAGSPRTG